MDNFIHEFIYGEATDPSRLSYIILCKTQCQNYIWLYNYIWLLLKIKTVSFKKFPYPILSKLEITIDFNGSEGQLQALKNEIVNIPKLFL